MKRKQQQLHADQNTLIEKWGEILALEQELEARCEGQPKPYPHRHLLTDFNDEVAENVPLQHDRVD